MQTQVWAHRGARLEEAENCLPAFTRALHLGADGLECDVQLSSDGVLVVTHDEKLKRVSGDSHYVAELSFAELRKLNMAAYRENLPPCQIPTLEEVLQLVKEEKSFLNIELKNSVIRYEGMEEKVIELVQSLKMEDQVLYSSFSADSVRLLASLVGAEKAAYLTEEAVPDFISSCERLGCKVYHPRHKYLKSRDEIERAHERGLRIHTWTVNRRHSLRRVMKLGVDAVISDNPVRAIEVRRQMQSEYF